MSRVFVPTLLTIFGCANPGLTDARCSRFGIADNWSVQYGVSSMDADMPLYIIGPSSEPKLPGCIAHVEFEVSRVSEGVEAVEGGTFTATERNFHEISFAEAPVAGDLLTVQLWSPSKLAGRPPEIYELEVVEEAVDSVEHPEVVVSSIQARTHDGSTYLGGEVYVSSLPDSYLVSGTIDGQPWFVTGPDRRLTVPPRVVDSGTHCVVFETIAPDGQVESTRGAPDDCVIVE